MSTIVLKNRYDSLSDINLASPKRKRSNCEQDSSPKNSIKKSREDLPKGINFPKDNQDVQNNSGNKIGNKVMVEHPLFCTNDTFRVAVILSLQNMIWKPKNMFLSLRLVPYSYRNMK